VYARSASGSQLSIRSMRCWSLGAFSGDGGLATLAGLKGPSGVAVTASGGFLIADSNDNRVRFVDADLRRPTGA
jgi:NHL repeat-containing protein